MANIHLQGSERAAIAGAQVLGPADSAERLEVSVILHCSAPQDLSSHIAALVSGQRTQPLSREEFARKHGAAAADIDAVRAFAQLHRLQVVQEHAARRTVVLAGTVAQFNAAFGVTLQRMQHDGGSYRGRVGTIQLPASLNGVVQAVLGLDNQPQAKPHFRVRRPPGNIRWRPASAAAISFTPLEVAALYGFPAGTGQGECVALIELGGGYRPADLKTYFQNLGVTAPGVVAVSVDHAANTPTGDANGPDGEVMLDIEVVGALVPQAMIAVYFAPNTDAGFLDAITTAVHDTTHKPSVLSISWGGPESSWTAQARTAMDNALQAAAAMGVTVCVASGDNGSSDGVDDGADHVDFPASSPFALACGGTSLRGSGSRIDSESVWNDGANNGATGGGVSTVFARAAWQNGLNTTGSNGTASPLTMRGVPDVAGNADPETGYEVRIDGTDTVIGGTSAVAPLWAALITRLNQRAGKRLGYLNPALYTATQGLRDVTAGNNGDFEATKGWDACTGLGSPGSAIGGALT